MRALVTGGAKRLGREISTYLASRGYDVAVHYNNSESEALDVTKEINSLGRISECLKCDLLVEDEVKELVNRASEAIGGQITLLVNNASIFEYDSFEDATRKTWDRHIESNLRAPFVLTQDFAKQSLAPILDEKNENKTAVIAAELASKEKIKIIVKGHIHTDVLMKEVIKTFL